MSKCVCVSSYNNPSPPLCYTASSICSLRSTWLILASSPSPNWNSYLFIIFLYLPTSQLSYFHSLRFCRDPSHSRIFMFLFLFFEELVTFIKALPDDVFSFTSFLIVIDFSLESVIILIKSNTVGIKNNLLTFFHDRASNSPSVTLLVFRQVILLLLVLLFSFPTATNKYYYNNYYNYYDTTTTTNTTTNTTTTTYTTIQFYDPHTNLPLQEQTSQIPRYFTDPRHKSSAPERDLSGPRYFHDSHTQIFRFGTDLSGSRCFYDRITQIFRSRDRTPCFFFLKLH